MSDDRAAAGGSAAWTSSIQAITLFVPDLAAAREFYQRAFALSVHYEDAVSAVFKFGGTLVNLLVATEADELIGPAQVAAAQSGSRFVLTLSVDDVDEMVGLLRDRGVALLNGPMDRPWGIRTASFMDPAGHIWEIAK